MSPDLPELLTIAEVAALMRISEKAVRARIDRGALPGVVRGLKPIRVRRDELRKSLGLSC